MAPDGSLRILDAQRQHTGNYTCTAANSNGAEHITYSVRVQGSSVFKCSNVDKIDVKKNNFSVILKRRPHLLHSVSSVFFNFVCLCVCFKYFILLSLGLCLTKVE